MGCKKNKHLKNNMNTSNPPDPSGSVRSDPPDVSFCLVGERKAKEKRPPVSAPRLRASSARSANWDPAPGRCFGGDRGDLTAGHGRRRAELAVVKLEIGFRPATMGGPLFSVLGFDVEIWIQ